MKVKLVQSTPDPEETACIAARNDYRQDGVMPDEYDFEAIMAGVEPDEEHLMDAIPPIEEKKRTLLDHLIVSGHWGPFEHPQATVAINDVTRVVTHQLVRHRHFTFDQQSFRYVGLDDVGHAPYERGEIADRFQFPQFRGKDFDVDREGVHEIQDVDLVHDRYAAAYTAALEHYRGLRDMGVPKEQARKVLPMGIKTNIVVSGNARTWLHFLNVRLKADVQAETRRTAEAILDELKGWMPYTFEKFHEDVFPRELNP